MAKNVVNTLEGKDKCMLMLLENKFNALCKDIHLLKERDAAHSDSQSGGKNDPRSDGDSEEKTGEQTTKHGELGKTC